MVTTRAHLEQLHQTGILTDRQHEILELRRRGFSQNTIARGLNITRSTVRSLERTAHDKIARHNQEPA